MMINVTRNISSDLMKSNVCYPDVVICIHFQTMWHVKAKINHAVNSFIIKTEEQISPGNYHC